MVTRQEMQVFFGEHRVLLAPMAGVSDIAFRSLCVEQGAHLTYTEMVSAKGLSYSNGKTRELLHLSPCEKSIAVQIFGHEPSVMADEAARIEDALQEKLAYIDINMGCPARKIVKKGDGAALMKSPLLAARIVDSVASGITSAVTVKFRRGFEEGNDTSLEFARILEESGAAALTLHGRYAAQLYRERADWECLRQVKRHVSIPIIGNGDIKDAYDATDMFGKTGCDAIMVGRAARGNPWIFAQIDAAVSGKPIPEKPTEKQRIEMARNHARALRKAYGTQGLTRMRKHAMWYVAGLPGAACARGNITKCRTLEEFDKVFDELSEYGRG